MGEESMIEAMLSALEGRESTNKCPTGDPIWMVAEGYGVCRRFYADSLDETWWAWRFFDPDNGSYWPKEGGMWRSWGCPSKVAALACIADDIERTRASYALAGEGVG